MCSLELVTSENTYILRWPDFYLEMFTSKEIFFKNSNLLPSAAPASTKFP